MLGVELDPGQPERAREEMLGVEPRALDAAGREVVGRAREHLGQCHRSSARRRSSDVRASVKSSRAPFRTCSSGTFTFTRWSVTRLCGKLYVRIFSAPPPPPTRAPPTAAPPTASPPP